MMAMATKSLESWLQDQQRVSLQSRVMATWDKYVAMYNTSPERLVIYTYAWQQLDMVTRAYIESNMVVTSFWIARHTIHDSDDVFAFSDHKGTKVARY
jgi:hypothetical protein